MPYLSASAVVIHYEEALYQVYAPLPLPYLYLTAVQPHPFVDMPSHRRKIVTIKQIIPCNTCMPIRNRAIL